MSAAAKSAEPPGPRGHWLLGCAPAMQADMLGFYQDVARDYGDIAKLRVMHLTFYFLNSPQHIHHVLAGNERNYRRSDFGNKLLAVGKSMAMRDLTFAIIPHSAHVNLQLPDGVDLPDPDGLIEGTGKRIRHVKIRSVEQASSPAVRAIVDAQVGLRR